MTRRKVPETCACPSCGMTADRFHESLEAEAREASLAAELSQTRIGLDVQERALAHAKAREVVLIERCERLERNVRDADDAVAREQAREAALVAAARVMLDEFDSWDAPLEHEHDEGAKCRNRAVKAWKGLQAALSAVPATPGRGRELRQALDEAARSLETIAGSSLKGRCHLTIREIQAYAGNRASVARAALGPAKGEGTSEGVSDGLSLPCSVCGEHTDIDYRASDDSWRIVTRNLGVGDPLGVICLACFMAAMRSQGLNAAVCVQEIQLAHPEVTRVFLPSRDVHHAALAPAAPKEARVVVDPQPFKYEAHDTPFRIERTPPKEDHGE